MPAVIGDGAAFDKFHRKPGRAFGEGACIVELGNRRMIQLCEGALLKEKALTTGGREPGIPENLDGREAREVFSKTEVDNAHATFTKQTLQSIRAKLSRNKSVAYRQVRSEALIEGRLGARVFFK